jgi:hypothetical protein
LGFDVVPLAFDAVLSTLVAALSSKLVPVSPFVVPLSSNLVPLFHFVVPLSGELVPNCEQTA